LHGDHSAQQFASILLEIGNVKIPIDQTDGQICMPTGFGNIVDTLDELQSSVYQNIVQHFNDQK